MVCIEKRCCLKKLKIVANLNFHPGPTKFQLNMVLEETWPEEDGCHLGYWIRTILAILNDASHQFLAQFDTVKPV